MKPPNQPLTRRLCALLFAVLALSTLAACLAQSHAAPRAGLVRLEGKAFTDDNGPFLGLGISYFQALRDARVDRNLLDTNLRFLSAQGFNYIRVLTMVAWDGLEIAPVTFTNRQGRVIEAWPDYWKQFGDLLEVAGKHRMRVEVTLFADAQIVMPSKSPRQEHMESILKTITGREGNVMHLEVANEAWQNGFAGKEGAAELRAAAEYLAKRTEVLVAITSNDDTSNEGIIGLYRGSAADLATVHFSRDTRTVERGWLPVADAYRAGNLLGVPPVTSNEPIGPGSSVAAESDPIKLCSAAIVAYLSNLPGYVFHPKTGIQGYAKCCPPSGPKLRFEETLAINVFTNVHKILPGDLPNWARNDGLEASAPFTVFANGEPNKYWPTIHGATNGCVRNIGGTRGSEFISLPMGILEGGVTLAPKKAATIQVLNPMTGQVVSNLVLKASEQFTLPSGPGAYLLKGKFNPQ